MTSIAASVAAAVKANRASRPPRAPKPEPGAAAVRKSYVPRARPSKLVDALAYHWRARPEAFTSVGLASSDRDDPIDVGAIEPDGGRTAARAARPRPHYKPGVATPNGPAEWIARLAARGIVLRLAHDPRHFLVESAGGGLDDPTRAAIRAASPLLLAYLQGTPLVCLAGDHGKGRWQPAVTLLVGGCPACSECAGRGAP